MRTLYGQDKHLSICETHIYCHPACQYSRLWHQRSRTISSGCITCSRLAIIFSLLCFIFNAVIRFLQLTSCIVIELLYPPSRPTFQLHLMEMNSSHAGVSGRLQCTWTSKSWFGSKITCQQARTHSPWVRSRVVWKRVLWGVSVFLVQWPASYIPPFSPVHGGPQVLLPVNGSR